MTISSFCFLDTQRFMKHRCDGDDIFRWLTTVKNSKIDFFIHYEKTALQIFFLYFVRMFFGS